ncbi:MAG: TPM domain-containing protein [Clostridia bacterium]|nr:TPM domain-containing protein [Clostridia bacterium]
MKKIFALVFTVLLLIAVSVPSFAVSEYMRFIDVPGIVSEDQASALNAKLDSLSEKLQFDIVVIVMDDITNWEPEEAAEYLYDTYNYGYGPDRDGVLLMLSMAERDWAMTSTGFGQTAINADAQDYISDTIVPYLSAGNYNTAFSMFANLTEELVVNARNGIIYKTPYNAPACFGAGFVISFIVALIVVGGMKSQLKSVHAKAAAGDYVRKDTLNVTESRERFINSTVTRVRRESSSSGGRSGGGGSHTSSHGKF